MTKPTGRAAPLEMKDSIIRGGGGLAASLGASNPEPVTVDADGRIWREDGTQFVMPGLEPEKILRSEADFAAGRFRPLGEIKAEVGR